MRANELTVTKRSAHGHHDAERTAQQNLAGLHSLVSRNRYRCIRMNGMEGLEYAGDQRTAAMPKVTRPR